MKLRSWTSHSFVDHEPCLLRLDLNVPLSSGRILDDYKLKAGLKTIRQLPQQPLVIITHLGEPALKGKRYSFDKRYSTRPLVLYLQKKLRRRVFLAAGSLSALAKQARLLKKNEIMVLENIRFWPGEVKNDNVFAKQLAQLGSVYINDAFPVCHRAHASVQAITRYLPSYAGPQLCEEVRNLDTLLHRQKLVLILGGAKISTKLPLINNLLPRCQAVLIGGAMANTFLRARGHDIGSSLWESKELGVARRLTNRKIIIPSDVVVQRGSHFQIRLVSEINPTDKIVDIGPETSARYLSVIKKSRTLMWNGPLGVTEETKARAGTRTIIKALRYATQHGAFSVAGGGETIAALELLGTKKAVSWASTGGGASLVFLSGERLPGLTSLEKTV